MVDVDADRRAALIGGYVAWRRPRVKGKKAWGAGALHRLVERRLPLRAHRGKKEFRASLRRDGRINYKNRLFDTPNSAARPALGRPASGWFFWRYRDSKRQWVPLRNLKREGTMTWAAGADGCKGGWIVVLRNTRSGQIKSELVERITEVLEWKSRPKVLSIDIPIGLLDHAVPGGRDCDRAARVLLGQPRATSVFSPPARSVLKAKTPEEAHRLNKDSGPDAPGLPKQAFALFEKIREVDRFLSRSPRIRVVEVHPELCFYEMNRQRPVVEPKKTAAGRKRRIRLLEGAWRRKLSEIIESRPRGVGRDDIIDAMAACWTAVRVMTGDALQLPAEPCRDSRGLRMEIFR